MPTRGMSSTGVVYCNKDDTIFSWDRNSEALLGWSHEEVFAKNLFGLIYPTTEKGQKVTHLFSLFHPYGDSENVTLSLKAEAYHCQGFLIPVTLHISKLPDNSLFVIVIEKRTPLVEMTDEPRINMLQFEVVNTILEISLGPALLKDKLTSILSYLVHVEPFNLSPAASLFLVEQDTKMLVKTVQYGINTSPTPPCEEVRFGHCYCGRAAESGNPLYIPAGENEHADTHGHYCLPLIVDKEIIGVVNLHTPADHQQSSLTERVFAEVARVLGSLIESQKMDLQLIDLVNDLRQTVSAVRDEQNFSESIIQGLQHGLIVTNQAGIIQKHNAAARSIFKWVKEDLNDKDLATLIGHNNCERIFEHKQNVAQSDDAELSVTPPTGESLILRFSTIVRPVLNSNELVRIISLTDISDTWRVRKEMEKVNRLTTIAEIASAVAHEVRNPLAGIKIMAQSIEEDSGSGSERLECSRRIIRQVDRLNQLLTDFFSYARPLRPKKQEASLTDILEETKPLISNKLSMHRIQLREDFEHHLPTVIADPHQLQQVFLNLFLNAIDAIKQEGSIEVSARKLNGDNIPSSLKTNSLIQSHLPYILVHFKDNGAGMSKSGVERVFEPFYTTKTNGSGLGMSIVHRTLQENDGSIWVESIEGQGTTFSMILKAGR